MINEGKRWMLIRLGEKPQCFFSLPGKGLLPIGTKGFGEEIKDYSFSPLMGNKKDLLYIRHFLSFATFSLNREA